ncbi:hypothetical protein B0H63DRAFT_497699 [Podospora didyma]|uniref:Ubiquitin 3 binding protein But2 C-terminal domain-containing protein n=1 Tax=Podospora didyma TaxID=330526 RepID=A0AAE0N2D8_9PEZI|nr:hypothetical protein B0H63DRAFT_497699 [Podospora didyma]
MLTTLSVAVAALGGTALGLPNPTATDDTPVRILPQFWEFNITSLSGPGCPDFGLTDRGPFVTRPTFGLNTVDGSEIYYWHFAYPSLRTSIEPGTPSASIWCETTLSYAELDSNMVPVAKPGYHLKLHKNGTAMLASYELDDGVEAKWTFTYFPEGKREVVDTIIIDGPRSGNSYRDISPVNGLVQWPLPNCGLGTIRYRTQLTLTAKKDGARGSVSSEKVEYKDQAGWYGVQQGVSYDWEQCSS